MSSKHINNVRLSNIELYRIITMFAIMVHHYIVNSGLIDEMFKEPLSTKSIVFFLFGMWGKTGINCFVLITGYFMCTSNITLKKFLKLFLEVELYCIVIGIIFMMTGYESPSLMNFVRMFNPIDSVKDGFVSCFLLFYLFIPFLNVMIQNLGQRLHLWILLLSVGVYTIIGSTFFIPITFNYVTWFCVLYIIASYLRLYPIYKETNTKFWGYCSLVAILLAMGSVISILCVSQWFNKPFIAAWSYFFVADSNKILALLVAVCTFMFFKNLPIKHSKLINTIAASTFGVLLIHANSDSMRQWLWKDTCHNAEMFYTNYAYLHIIFIPILVYLVCTLIDYFRIKLIEPYLLNYTLRILRRKYWFQ